MSASGVRLGTFLWALKSPPQSAMLWKNLSDVNFSNNAQQTWSAWSPIYFELAMQERMRFENPAWAYFEQAQVMTGSGETFKVVWNFLSLIFQILFITTRYIYCTAVVIERLRRRLPCGPTPFLSFMCACGYICRPQVIVRSYTLGCDIPAWKWYALGCLWALGQASSLDRYAIVAFTVSSTTSK